MLDGEHALYNGVNKMFVLHGMDANPHPNNVG